MLNSATIGNHGAGAHSVASGDSTVISGNTTIDQASGPGDEEEVTT
jgi:hypothetical protein